MKRRTLPRSSASYSTAAIASARSRSRATTPLGLPSGAKPPTPTRAWALRRGRPTVAAPAAAASSRCTTRARVALPADVGHDDARLDVLHGLGGGRGPLLRRSSPRQNRANGPSSRRYRRRASGSAPARLGNDSPQISAPLSDGGWRDALDGETSKPYLFQLAQFVAKERKSKTVYPPPQDTFAALDACKLDDVKIVIVGQDPYHGPGQAHGLCFSIADGADCKFPPSLRNIFVELARDLPGTSLPPKGKGDLTKWAQRGVLLLNSSLTVRRGGANSAKAGWPRSPTRSSDGESAEQGRRLYLVGQAGPRQCANIDRTKHRVIDRRPRPCRTRRRRRRLRAPRASRARTRCWGSSAGGRSTGISREGAAARR